MIEQQRRQLRYEYTLKWIQTQKHRDLMVVLIVFDVALLNPDFIGRLVIPVRYSLAGTSISAEVQCQPSYVCYPKLLKCPSQNAMLYDNTSQEAHIKKRYATWISMGVQFVPANDLFRVDFSSLKS